ncbi:MAG: TetR/AcrR family transcriptional regulator [Vicinamibacterales bacterium]
MTRTGRPREFDIDKALETAMTIFWREGYAGASLNQIAAATGVGKPSLYAAFGDKEHLYLRALAHYGARLQERYAQALDAEPDAKRAIEALLLSAIESAGHGGAPGGCMVVAGAATCDADGVPPSVRRAIGDALHAGVRAIEQRLERGKREGQLPASADTAALASFYSTVQAGLAVQAQDRRCSQGLKAALSAAMMAWPQAASQARTPTTSAKRASARGPRTHG